MLKAIELRKITEEGRAAIAAKRLAETKTYIERVLEPSLECSAKNGDYRFTINLKGRSNSLDTEYLISFLQKYGYLEVLDEREQAVYVTW